jgi:hypothetical protein
LFHFRSSILGKIAVEGLQNGPESHRHRPCPVGTGGDAKGIPESPGESFVRRKPVIQGDVQNSQIRVPQRLQGKGQPPLPLRAVQACI